MTSAIDSFAFEGNPARGTVLGGKYHVEAMIAEGGSSCVYLARDKALDECVAIKVLMPEFRAETEIFSRFLREAKTIRRIQSDHCVKVLDVGEDPVHGPFIVMEYLEGRNLREILETEGRIVPARACELALQVCDALAAAHAIQCVHRDVKPGNVMVQNRGGLETVRVLDFGISKFTLTGSVLNRDLSLLNTVNLMGTPMYMSPEQMRSTAETDRRTDIWALGAMLYEMLAGRPPFMAESVTQLCSKVLEEEAVPLNALNPGIPAELAHVVQTCLRKKPDDRYENMGQLALALLPFAPRRARATAARVVSVLSAAGVPLDRSLISEYPPAMSAPPIAISFPAMRQRIDSTPTLLEVAELAAPRPVRRRTPIVMFGALVAGALMLVGGMALFAGRGDAAPVAATSVVAPPVMAPSPPPVTAASPPAIPAEPAPPAPPIAMEETHPVGIHNKAAAPRRPRSARPSAERAKVAVSSVEKSEDQAPEPAVTNRARLVEELPARPKIID